MMKLARRRLRPSWYYSNVFVRILGPWWQTAPELLLLTWLRPYIGTLMGHYARVAKSHLSSSVYWDLDGKLPPSCYISLAFVPILGPWWVTTPALLNLTCLRPYIGTLMANCPRVDTTHVPSSVYWDLDGKLPPSWYYSRAFVRILGPWWQTATELLLLIDVLPSSN
jgi:hypothetical protein